MKKKFSSMGRVAIALVLALSLSLVMALPVAADVTSAAVDNDPRTVGREAEYTIGFNTTAALFTGASNTITIIFPDGTTMPGEVDAPIAMANVKVNGTACNVNATVDTATRAVTITVPEDINPAGPVEVVINLAAGIKNPPAPAATNLILTVQTSAEPDPINSAAYSTIAVVAPTIVSVVGTAYQNSNDTIVITFSELVTAAWNAAFDTIKCGGSDLTLTGANFAYNTDTFVLTITLDEAVAQLETGADLEVTSLSETISNAEVDAYVSVIPVPGSVIGDSVAPTVVLEYSLARPVKVNNNPLITATFSEAMADTPTIAIVTSGDNLTATVMTTRISSTEWTYTYVVPAGSDGPATVTINGTDLAGNDVGAHTTATFEIDNTPPTIADTADDIGGTTIVGAGDKIVITFSEAVETTGGWAAAFTIDSVVDEVPTELVLGNAGFSYDAGTLTIILDEVDDEEYLVNGETLTVTPVDDAILDAALNPMAITPVVGTVAVGGDGINPTITGIVGKSTTHINIAFSELVLAVDGEWSANEFSIDSPAGAPLNINNAIYTPLAGVGTTVLEIALNGLDAAVLVPGEVICVTPTADAVVDLAGNKMADTPGDSGADSGWLAVWVDASWSSQADVAEFDPSLILGANAFATIQLAINAVAIDGTVNVLPGIYTLVEDPGNFAGLNIVTTGLILRSTSDAEDTFLDASACTLAGIYIRADDVIVDGFTVDGSLSDGILINYGFTGVTVTNNIITDAENAGIAMNHASQIPDAVVAEAIVSFNVIRNCGSGMNLAGCAFYCTIEDNTIAACTREGIGFEGGSELHPTKGNTITGNTITANSERGIWLNASETAPNDGLIFEENVIEENTISGNVGIGIEIDALLTITDLHINNNNITGNEMVENPPGVYTFCQIKNLSGDSVDATLNWWGSAFEPAIVEIVDIVDVVYSPWLDAPYQYGESTTTGSLTMEYPIELHDGWNLISLPLIPDDPSIETVLAGVSGNVIVNKVTYYDPAGDPNNPWLNWSLLEPGFNDLTEMNDGKGYWIDVTLVGEDGSGMLSVVGVELAQPGLAPPSYLLVEGWNLIGFTCIYDKKANIYLGPSVWASVEALYSFDATSGLYAAVEMGGGVEGTPGDLLTGAGYWIAVETDGRIFP